MATNVYLEAVYDFQHFPLPHSSPSIPKMTLKKRNAGTRTAHREHHEEKEKSCVIADTRKGQAPLAKGCKGRHHSSKGGWDCRGVETMLSHHVCRILSTPPVHRSDEDIRHGTSSGRKLGP
ncbi:uncharacterized protein LOC112560163 [Pomacea canaliculata]|uniref:uncharacterized protein LOC112560163 n=1 Tax=Pomacea canaliculata TaxID=400727 RepID=UPI000D737D74|nr:uncharacterized protein LOC112560163 [Pomacea canaliculata]XP_025087578.1 uncharacterized protein LOC112560163 [Pomacea canaliculata]XP_025087579.1 uncharacterized protein LOC112560163 [Pomacea canaliculata]